MVQVLSFAARNLLKERTRLLISVGGVAFSVLLIVMLRGLYVAYENKVSSYFESVPADLWVVQAGTADFFHSYSVLPDDSRAPVGSVPGVISAEPYLARQVGFRLDGADTLLYIAGFDPADPASGPVRMERGSRDVGADGIVVDMVFAAKHAIGVGDVLHINARDLTVTGISSGGDMVMFQYAFVTMRTARVLLSMHDVDNAFLLHLADGADAQKVADRVEHLSPQFTTRDTATMVEVNQRVITDSFLPVIRVLLLLGFAVGVAVIGLTIYSAVLEKRREYGVVKALGARTAQLVATVVAQALLAATGGYLLGVALAYAARSAATRWVPAFVADLVLSDLAWVGLATVGMAVIASVIPLARVARIDPAEVFRS